MQKECWHLHQTVLICDIVSWFVSWIVSEVGDNILAAEITRFAVLWKGAQVHIEPKRPTVHN